MATEPQERHFKLAQIDGPLADVHVADLLVDLALLLERYGLTYGGGLFECDANGDPLGEPAHVTPER